MSSGGLDFSPAVSKRPEQNSWFAALRPCPSCSLTFSSCPRQKGKGHCRVLSQYRLLPVPSKQIPGVTISQSPPPSLTDCHRYLITGFLASPRAAPENLFKRGAKLPCAQSIPVAFCFSEGNSGHLHSGLTETAGPCRRLSSSSPSPVSPSLLSPCPASRPPHCSLSSSAPLPGVPGSLSSVQTHSIREPFSEQSVKYSSVLHAFLLR